MSIIISPAIILISAIEDKLASNYGIILSLDGLDEMSKELEHTQENDYDTLRILNKETLYWSNYLIDMQSMLSIYLDRYKNIYDIYNYLQKLTKSDKSEFLKIAPKYKISTRDTETAILELANKKSEIEIFIKNLEALIKMLLSYSRYMTFHYYRTARLINRSYVSYKNTSTIT